MEFSIFAEFGIIEEAYKAYRLAACFLMVEITVNYQFNIGIFKYLFSISDNHPFLTASDLILGLVRFEASDLILGLVRFELAFWFFNWVLIKKAFTGCPVYALYLSIKY